MLSDLDAVDWEQLDSTEVNLIRSLTSDLLETRDNALSKLFYLMRSGLDKSSITPYVIPFLLEILRNTIWLKQKTHILTILWELANTWDEKTYSAEIRGMPVYLDLLNDPDADVRVNSVQLICFFHELAFQSFPCLIDQTNIEKDVEVRAAILWSIGWLLADNQEIEISQKFEMIQHLTKYLAFSENKLVRLAAAISIARIMASQAPVDVDAVLIEGVAFPNSYPEFHYIRDLDHPGWYTTYDALWSLGTTRNLRAFEQSLDSANTPFVAHSIAFELLNHAFSSNMYLIYDTVFFHLPNRIKERTSGFLKYLISEPVDVYDITDEQKAAVLTVLNCDQIWEIQNNLLQLYGLPASREITRGVLN